MYSREVINLAPNNQIFKVAYCSLLGDGLKKSFHTTAVLYSKNNKSLTDGALTEGESELNPY